MRIIQDDMTFHQLIGITLEFFMDFGYEDQSYRNHSQIWSVKKVLYITQV